MRVNLQRSINEARMSTVQEMPKSDTQGSPKPVLWITFNKGSRPWNETGGTTSWVAPNYSQPTTKSLGANCAKNGECQSDNCEGNRCVCKSDSECPGNKAAIPRWLQRTIARFTSKGLGVSCSKNSQCRSDKCQGGACVFKKMIATSQIAKSAKNQS